MPTLYVSDLDGTLLGDDAQLSAHSRTRLCAMLDEGLEFTVASARSVASIAMMLKDVPITLPVIEFNGAFLSDLQTGRHEIVNSIAPDVASAVYDLIQTHGHQPIVSTFTGTADRAYYGEVANEGVRWYVNDRISNADKRWMHLDNLKVSLGDQVVCFTVIDRCQPLEVLEAQIVAACGSLVETHIFESMYAPGWHWLTVHDWRATKDRAITTLRQAHGLAGHELVVFGDQNNDIKMFNIADRAIAVGNATEQVKACATQVIGPSNANSVVDFIEAEWRLARR